MSKKTKKLEKENQEVRGKFETMNANVLKMIEEVFFLSKDSYSQRNLHLKTIESTTAAKTKLEKLCRALQLERTQMQTKLDQMRESSAPVEKTDDQESK